MSSAADHALRAGTGRDAAARDLPDGLRMGLAGACLLAFLNHTPLTDLSNPAHLDAWEGGNLKTQVLFLGLFAAMAWALWRLGIERLRPLLSLPLLACAAWLGATLLTSADPLLSIRRAVLLGIVAVLAAGVLVLMRSVRQFALTLAGVSAVLIGGSFLAVALVPGLSVHNSFDLLNEPAHTGLWRGLFAHKNEAGGVMAMLVLVGLFVVASGERAIGWAIVAGAAVFLAGTTSKTAIALVPIVLVSTGLCRLLPGRLLRAGLLLGPVLALSVITLGSVFVPAVEENVGKVLPDTSFTGRTEIWEFAAEKISERPVTGWGYGAFWRTERTMYGGAEALTWVQTADHGHNGFIDTALVIGLPGLALTLIAFAWMPLRDLQRAAPTGAIDPATMLFLRLWMYGLTSASFESTLYSPNAPPWCLFILAVFGLRMRAALKPVAG
ncbi:MULTISPECIES: O-antigen ligase [Methylobacterium]|uniref:O-antigen ligase-related domain-containing protein n=4 Tax=Pseudomonadota TaxID=1224 RepID=A0ABQ4STR4_9HYPH|nr:MULTISPECIES: O-antigen ligase [Methylobacterium]PIU04565.1 MAG: polymerase [Methylobacterium sp. CG09_land_8_20_14_0_10_71_15]PIU13858.1 MAG: polymerase [Methylobacterium sp. CG08_land_8_20_14_0_20_71_15]GBU16191.1 O-antigen polymerase [Methylobacterium sp.]GJE05875.1 hypothetical protein AOPFMNJM_1181 [Methylobacterium jeotgali]